MTSFGVTRERVRQIESRALGKLREAVTGSDILSARSDIMRPTDFTARVCRVAQVRGVKVKIEKRTPAHDPYAKQGRTVR